jgi:hypothetical protein
LYLIAPIGEYRKVARITEVDDLLFPVEIRPIYMDMQVNGTQTKIAVPNNKIIVNTRSDAPLGVVSNGYKLFTNHEAIELGKRCCTEIFGSKETENIEIFQVDAPSTASYCHIDLVHKNYIMNLWDEAKRSEIYVPYLRITNSYNRSRALRFDFGFCIKICFNGIIS